MPAITLWAYDVVKWPYVIVHESSIYYGSKFITKQCKHCGCVSVKHRTLHSPKRLLKYYILFLPIIHLKFYTLELFIRFYIIVSFPLSQVQSELHREILVINNMKANIQPASHVHWALRNRCVNHKDKELQPPSISLRTGCRASVCTLFLQRTHSQAAKTASWYQSDLKEKPISRPS